MCKTLLHDIHVVCRMNLALWPHCIEVTSGASPARRCTFACGQTDQGLSNKSAFAGMIHTGDNKYTKIEPAKIRRGSGRYIRSNMGNTMCTGITYAQAGGKWATVLRAPDQLDVDFDTGSSTESLDIFCGAISIGNLWWEDRWEDRWEARWVVSSPA